MKFLIGFLLIPFLVVVLSADPPVIPVITDAVDEKCLEDNYAVTCKKECPTAKESKKAMDENKLVHCCLAARCDKCFTDKGRKLCSEKVDKYLDWAHEEIQRRMKGDDGCEYPSGKCYFHFNQAWIITLIVLGSLLAVGLIAFCVIRALKMRR